MYLKEWADDRYATVALPRNMDLSFTVAVFGIYREPVHRMVAAIGELRVSGHKSRIYLGAMGRAAPELVDETVAEYLSAGKFQNLNGLIAAAPLHDVDWILLIDDDVVLPGGFLDAFLAVCERLDLGLAQPAQTRYSNANWPVTRRKLLSVARETSFVEIGPVTAIRRDVLELLIPFPIDLRFGWGLDFHWAAIMVNAGLRMGVVDATAVRHTDRAVASTYSWDAAQEEGRRFLATVPHLPTTVGYRTVRTHRVLRDQVRR